MSSKGLKVTDLMQEPGNPRISPASLPELKRPDENERAERMVKLFFRVISMQWEGVISSNVQRRHSA